jgi:hypothetical protein
VSRAGWWDQVGLVVLAIGFLGAVLGFACALAFIRLNRGPDAAARWAAWRRARVVLLLLALNFPIAFAYAVAAVWWEGSVALRLTRGSDAREVDITGYAGGRLDDSRIVIAEGFRVSVEKLRR